MHPRRPYTLRLPDGRPLELGARTLVMGILNVTPDSFSDGAAYADPARAVDAALAMIEAGADIIDVGGESTRPGADVVDAAEERRRVVPVVEAIASQAPVPLSIDTTKGEVARAALDAGAAIVNDISGLRYDPSIGPLVASRGAPLVLMHMRGRPADMHRAAVYGDAVADVRRELDEAIRMAVAAGVPRDQIVIDPGIGFAKRPAHSLELLARLPALAALDRPLLVGPSRKSFLTAAMGERPAPARDWGTAAAVTAAVLLGAHIVRVHAVREMVDVVRVADALRQHGIAAGASGAPGC